METNRKAQAIAGVCAVLAVLGLAAPAFALPYDPTSDVTSMATDAASTAAPIVVAVGGAFVALAVTVFAVRWVLGAVRKGGR